MQRVDTTHPSTDEPTPRVAEHLFVQPLPEYCDNHGGRRGATCYDLNCSGASRNADHLKYSNVDGLSESYAEWKWVSETQLRQWKAEHPALVENVTKATKEFAAFEEEGFSGQGVSIEKDLSNGIPMNPAEAEAYLEEQKPSLWRKIWERLVGFARRIFSKFDF